MGGVKKTGTFLSQRHEGTKRRGGWAEAETLNLKQPEYLTHMIGVNKTSNRDGDPRVAQALDDLGLNYKIDADGIYHIVVEIKEGRSQIGLIRSETFTFGGVEMREISSAGLRSNGPFDPRTMNLLLQQNAEMKAGAWAVLRGEDDEHLAIFVANVSANLAGDLLRDVLAAVLLTADKMEERLSGRDDF